MLRAIGLDDDVAAVDVGRLDALATAAVLREVARMRSWTEHESEEHADALIERTCSSRKSHSESG